VSPRKYSRLCVAVFNNLILEKVAHTRTDSKRDIMVMRGRRLERGVTWQTSQKACHKFSNPDRVRTMHTTAFVQSSCPLAGSSHSSLSILPSASFGRGALPQRSHHAYHILVSV